MTGMKDRPTSDLVVIFLSAVVGLVLLIGVLGLILLKLFQPEEDIDGNFKTLADVLTVVVGAIIGFIGGRVVTTNGNGKGGETHG